MKTIAVFALALCGPVLFLSSTTPEKKISIQEAVKTGQITAKATARGGHSGNIMGVALSSNSKEKLIVVIPAGTVFTAANSGEQDILVVKEQRIPLSSSGKVNISANGFCCQAHDLSPNTGSGFSVSFTKNEKLKKLAEHISKNDYPQSVFQYAVWCVSDGQSVTNIYAQTREEYNKIKPLREFICTLTGEEDKWYSTPQESILTPERMIVSQPVKVTGELTFEVTKGDVLRREVIGPDGKARDNFSYSSVEPMGGTLTFEFSMQVLGWEKGTYQVLVYSNDKVLLKQEFEI